MKRRAFITLLSGAAAWPVAARAQRSERMRRIGVLMGLAAGDPEAQSRVAAFESGLRELGWVKGRNLRIEYRWAGDGNVLRDHAAAPLRRVMNARRFIRSPRRRATGRLPGS